MVATASLTRIDVTTITGVELISSGGFSGVKVTGSAADDFIDMFPFTLSGIQDLLGGAGNDTILSAQGGVRVSGEDGDDVLMHFGAATTLSGGNGNDFVQGGTENDSLSGGLGNDTFGFSGGVDTIRGSDGPVFNALEFDTIDYSGQVRSFAIDTFQITDMTSGVTSIYDGIERIITGSGNDTVSTTAAVRIIDGAAATIR